MRWPFVAGLCLASAAIGAVTFKYSFEIGTIARSAADSEPDNPIAQSIKEAKLHAKRAKALADAVINMCGDVDFSLWTFERAAIDRWLKEAESLKAKGDSVRRIGPRLILKTKAGEVSLDDAGYLCVDTFGALYTYMGILQTSGMYMIAGSHWEWQSLTFVSQETGAISQIFEVHNLTESPRAIRIAASSPHGMETGRLGIWRVENGRLIEESLWEFGEGVQSVGIDGWIDDESLHLTICKDVNRCAPLVLSRASGKWEDSTGSLVPPSGPPGIP